MQRFWYKIKKKFETTINCKYIDVSKQIKHLISKRKVNIKILHKSNYTTQDNN